MRLSELFGAAVVDRDGQALGKIHDARLVQDGPVVTGFGNALRVDGVVVGEGALAVRLGYHRNGITGPWLLRTLAQRIEHRTRYVRWEQIASIDESGVTLRCSVADLPFLRDIESLPSPP